MSNRSGTAGKSTRQMAQRRRNIAIWIAIVALAVIVIIALVVQNSKVLGLSGGAVLVLLVVMGARMVIGAL